MSFATILNKICKLNLIQGNSLELINFKNLLIFLVGDPNAWRLGRIEETDHETAV